MNIKFIKENGISIVELKNNGGIEKHITVVFIEGETFDGMFQRLVDAVGDAKIIFQIGFGSNDAYKKYIEFMKDRKNLNIPVAWVSGDTDTNDLSGIFTITKDENACIPIFTNDGIAGYKIKDDYADYIYLSNIESEIHDDSYINQTKDCFVSAKNILEQNEMHMNNIVRTWFYNNKILRWYGEFNQVRSRFYLENGLIDNLIPASTGIGACNPFGKALILSLLAVNPYNPLCRIRKVDSPLQSTAQAYGSTFSRAIEISTPTLRRLFVSGTASIDKSGCSIHKTNIGKQIEHTLEVVKCILDSNKMGYSDVTRAFCYFREKRHIKYFNEYCKKNNYILNTHIINTTNTICRDELLFEMELDAICLNKK